MQVGILPAAPLPDSVKVARRPVKPLVLVRVQVWQPFLEGRQIQAGCTCLENRIGIAEVGALPTPSAILCSEPTTLDQNEGSLDSAARRRAACCSELRMADQMSIC